MLRMSDNPVARFPEGRSLEADLGAWRLAYVKSRQEKALAQELRQGGVSYYLPLVEKRTRRKDNGKLRKSLLALFPGYLAFADYGEIPDQVFDAGRVTSVLPIADQTLFVTEMGQIQRLLGSGAELEVMPGFLVGQAVLVKRGPLQGLRGIVTAAKGGMRLAVQVQLFQRTVLADVDETALDAV